MVSTKNICAKTVHKGDESPSPEPFKEPEGLVTIDLSCPRMKNEGVQKTNSPASEKRKLILKIMFALFLLNITVFGVLVLINEETHIFTAKPLDKATERTFNRDGEQIEILIKKCVLTKPLKICCLLFAEANFQFNQFCFDHIFTKTNERIRRDLEHAIEANQLHHDNFPYGPIDASYNYFDMDQYPNELFDYYQNEPIYSDVKPYPERNPEFHNDRAAHDEKEDISNDGKFKMKYLTKNSHDQQETHVTSGTEVDENIVQDEKITEEDIGALTNDETHDGRPSGTEIVHGMDNGNEGNTNDSQTEELKTDSSSMKDIIHYGRDQSNKKMVEDNINIAPDWKNTENFHLNISLHDSPRPNENYSMKKGSINNFDKTDENTRNESDVPPLKHEIDITLANQEDTHNAEPKTHLPSTEKEVTTSSTQLNFDHNAPYRKIAPEQVVEILSTAPATSKSESQRIFDFSNNSGIPYSKNENEESDGKITDIAHHEQSNSEKESPVDQKFDVNYSKNNMKSVEKGVNQNGNDSAHFNEFDNFLDIKDTSTDEDTKKVQEEQSNLRISLPTYPVINAHDESVGRKKTAFPTTAQANSDILTKSPTQFKNSYNAESFATSSDNVENENNYRNYEEISNLNFEIPLDYKIDETIAFQNRRHQSPHFEVSNTPPVTESKGNDRQMDFLPIKTLQDNHDSLEIDDKIFTKLFENQTRVETDKNVERSTQLQPSTTTNSPHIIDTMKMTYSDAHEEKNRNENSNLETDKKIREKSEMPIGTIDLQSSQQTFYNPCFNSMNQYIPAYKIAPFDTSQVLKIVPSSPPKVSQYIINPPMYPYMQSPYMLPQQYIPQVSQQIQRTPLQVTGPNGQYYVCNPVSAPNNNVVANNIANLPGVEVRRDASNLQDLIVSIPEEEKQSNKSREADILCPLGYQACSDGSKCIPKHKVCDNEIHCIDGSDEIFCTCRDRVGPLRICDGYFDCPRGEDELGCFGCKENEFSCDDWSKFRKSMCIPIEQRCDNTRQCEITGKDEEDCSILTDFIGEQPFNKISNSVGFLHRNYKGKWYPACFGVDSWASDVCGVESGPSTILPKTHMVPTFNNYNGYYINTLPDQQISLVKMCVKDRAAFVECPALYCGMRISVQNPFRHDEVDVSAENMVKDMERVASRMKNYENDPIDEIDKKKELIDIPQPILGDSRVVGGKPSQPAAWPWLVIIYKNGVFHCGGVLINEWWIVTAAHCVDRYWQYYYEIRAGVLRRFSYAPMEERRRATVAIPHESYDRSKLLNDIAIMKMSAPFRYNRNVRPICLPSESTGGRDFASGPTPGTICTTVGWGATMEHGSDPDHMQEVEIPILERCKQKDDFGDGEICAGLSEGGKDACQGDSGGPLMCRNPNNPSQWYLAGIVSHGEGCARPDEPGVYTKVAKYIGWIAENMAEDKFTSRFPLQHCPGFMCKYTKNCIPTKHHCDKLVDCLFGDDELNCQPRFMNAFNHFRSNGNSESENILRASFANNLDAKGTTEMKSVPVAPDVELKSNRTQENGDYFVCRSLLQLIPSHKRCNKMVDCEDGMDEEECECADYVKSQNPKAICDGITDCYDLTDEKCGCQTNEYQCRQSQECIALSKRCDGTQDCSKSEDEWDCVALTNGETITFDSDSRPNLFTTGIVTINQHGIWRPLCMNVTEKAATTATNVCNLLGFEEYSGYQKFQVKDHPLYEKQTVPENGENETCNGLFVKCSDVSLDSTVHNVHLDNVTDDVELYTSPWNAVIYADGIYRCMGAILNARWIVTSVNCFDGITMLNLHYVAVLLGKGKATLQVKGPHEETLRVIQTTRIPDTDIILLRTENTMKFSRYIKQLRLNIRRDGRRKEKCIAIGVHENKAKYEFLNPIEKCVVGSRCFEIKMKNNCTESGPWSGSIICDSGSGWYPSAVFSEPKGLCGLTSVKQYTSLPYNKNRIFKAMENITVNIEAPICEGFRCALGECISKIKTCNGIEDCRGGEDEAHALCYESERLCHLTGDCTCQPSELRCRNKNCIPKSKFCDRKDDCGDSSDEPDICNCRSYLELTSPDKICDGRIHCMDRSDEDPQVCPCPVDGFQCISTELCITNDMVCDGFNDCPNAEDEKLCLDIVDEHNQTSNAGELVSRTGGVWHPGCFNKTYSPEELESMCQNMGTAGVISTQLPPPKNLRSINTMRAVLDKFNIIWIRREINNKFKIGLRTGNEPYVHFVPDENCFRTFLACM